MQLGVLHYRRRGRRSSVTDARRQSLRLVAVLGVPGVRVVCALGGAAVRLSLPYRLARARRVGPVIVGGALRDVVLVVMGVGDLVRLRYAELLDLVEAGLAGGPVERVRRPPRVAAAPLLLLPLRPFVLLVLLAPLVAAASVTPRLSRVVVRVVPLLLLRMRRGQVIDGLVARQGGRTVVRVNEGCLQGANYRGMVEAAR